MGRPPKANRAEIADITLSFRFTTLEREALERLAQRRSAELRGTGATVSATSLGRAIVRKELEDSGVYAEVERERANQSASPAPPAQGRLLGLDDIAPEPRRTWGTSSPAAAVPLSAAPQLPAAVSHLKETPPATPATPPAAVVAPAVELPAPAREARPVKALNGSAKLATKAKGKPVKASAAPAPKGKAKPTRPTLKPKSKPAPTPPRGRR